MIVHKYKEWIITNPKEEYWVWDTYDEFPMWDDKTQDYVFKKQPKRISAKKARHLIDKYKLICVYKDEDGEIYK